MPATPDIWLQWPFWRNTLAVGVALCIAWMIMASLPNHPTADPIQAENRQLNQYIRQLEQEVARLRAQVGDFQTLEQVQQEMIVELRAGNQELQDRLFTLEKDVQRYREVMATRNPNPAAAKS